MSSTGDKSDSLIDTVRRRLASGETPEAIAADLVANGMSGATAQRFVSRAKDEANASPPQTVPWLRVLAVTAVPCALALVLVGVPALLKRREAQLQSAALLAAADRSRADRNREDASARRAAANEARTARLDARVERAVSQLSSRQGTTQCDAALLLGRLGATQHIGPLIDLMASVPAHNARGCAAAALVTLGQADRVLPTYVEWANGTDSDLRRSAIAGFGDIGPSAADTALPYLAADMQSPNWEARYLAIRTLANLGPAGVPLIRAALNDEEPHVRELAAEALKASAPAKP